jgi:hypothetical protein
MSNIYGNANLTKLAIASQTIQVEVNTMIENDAHPHFEFFLGSFDIVDSKYSQRLRINTFPNFSDITESPLNTFRDVEFLNDSSTLKNAVLQAKISETIFEIEGMLGSAEGGMLIDGIVNHIYQASVNHKLEAVYNCFKDMQTKAYDWYEGRTFFSEHHDTPNIIEVKVADKADLTVDEMKLAVLKGVQHFSNLKTKTGTSPNLTVTNIGVVGNSTHLFNFSELSPNERYLKDNNLFIDNNIINYKAVNGLDDILGNDEIIIFSRRVSSFPIIGKQFGALEFDFFGNQISSEKIDRWIKLKNPGSILLSSNLTYNVVPHEWHNAVLVKFVV